MKKLVFHVDYDKSNMTSYQISDWIIETFGEKEIKDEFEEIRDSSGRLKQIKFAVSLDN